MNWRKPACRPDRRLACGSPTMKKRIMKRITLFITFNIFLSFIIDAQDTSRPNIILVMSDDKGWGQTGYMAHPILKTPNLDAMAVNGLRFNRFYAGAPVCSPTRASVLTGR